jgi:hypothetical protein
MNDLKSRRGRRTRIRAIEQMIHEKRVEISAAEIALHGLDIELEDLERIRRETELRRKNRNDSTKLRQARTPSEVSEHCRQPSYKPPLK